MIFNLKVKNNVLKEVCSETLKDPIRIIEKILRDMYGKIHRRTYDLNIEKAVVDFFKNEDEFSYVYLEKSKKDIENYLIYKINYLKDAIKKVEKKYELHIEGELYDKKSKDKFISSNIELKRVENLLKGIENIKMH